MAIRGIRNIKKIANGFEKLEKQLPTLAGGWAVAQFKRSFRRQGFIQNRTVQKWPERKRNPGRKRRGRRAVLVQSGRLRRSIRVTEKGRTNVNLGTDVPYARIHNEGGTINQSISITPKMRKFFWAMFYKTGDVKYKYMALKRGNIQRSIDMPKRQFMGFSKFVQDYIEKNIEKEVEEVLRKATH